MKTLLTTLFSITVGTAVFAQNDGDYRSKSTTGTWSNASSWEVYDVVLIVIGGWTDASGPPGNNTKVTIQNGHTMTMTANAACGNLVVNGTVEIGSNQLALNGTLTNSGAIKANGNSSLVINGSGSLTLALSQLSSGTTNKLTNLTINRGSTPGGGSVTLSADIQVSGVVTLNGGTLNSGGYLTLLSSASSTARVAQIDTTKASISGSVNVQRYMAGGDRDWRFMTAPVTTSSGLAANWQQQIFITGPVSTGGSICPSFSANTNNGIDPTQSGNYSIYTYNGTWVPVTNTLSKEFSPGEGLRVFFRGARSQGCSIIDGTNATPQSTVLEASGSIGMGTVSCPFSATSDGWLLVGNPYPSPINWDASGWNTMRTSSGNTVNNAFYIYNPAVNGYSSYVNGVSDGNGCSNIISSGQAFFVKADNSSAVLTFKEAYKASETNDLFGKVAGKPQINLRVSTEQSEDRVTCYLETGADGKFDKGKDAYKIQLGAHGVALKKMADTSMLAIAALCPLTNEKHGSDTFVVYTKFKSGESFTMCAVINENWPTGLTVWLVDKMTGKKIPIDKLKDEVFVADQSDQERFLLIIGKELYNGVGLPEHNKGKVMRVVPNPVVNNKLRLWNMSEQPITSINIFNGAGVLVWRGVADCTVGTCISDISTLNSGYYLAELQTADNVLYRAPFVKE